MKSKEYISSGDISLLVLGLLPQEQADEIWAAAKQDSALKAAIVDAEDELLDIDNALAKEVPKPLKNHIFEDIQSQRFVITDNKIEKSTLVPLLRYLSAASVVLALLSSILAYTFYQKWQETNTSYQSLAMKNQVLADNVETTTQLLNEKTDLIGMLTDQNTLTVSLSGLPIQPNASVNLYFDTSKEKLLLSVNELENLPTSEDYQLWGIVDGVPVSVGIINQDKKIIQKLAFNSTNPSAFAITIEPKGGSINPTLDQMVVFGAVKSS